MSQQFEVRWQSGFVDGPMSAEKIRMAAKAGEIQPGCELRAVGSESWIPAEKVRGVREHLVLSRGGIGAAAAAAATPGADAEGSAASSGSAIASAPVAHSPAESSTTMRLEERGYIPQYGVLRSWARSIVSIGWILNYFGICGAISVALGVPLGGHGWAWGIFAGLAVARMGIGHMKAEASRDRPFLWVLYLAFGLPSAVMCAVFVCNWLLSAIEPGAEWLRSVWAWAETSLQRSVDGLEILWICVQMSLSGLLGIVVGEWLFAQADVASNSWRRQQLPTAVDR
jgi:hypothetical protein